jgi:GT2 family glycosyltransferase
MAVAEVDQPAGAFVMFSRRAWESVGGFDERFWPVWFEDVDFFKRVKEAGYHIFYTPETRAVHGGAHSVRMLNFERREEYWYGNLLEYAAKHYSKAALRTVCIAVAVGAGLRAIAGVPGHGMKAIAVYSEVLKLSAERFRLAGKADGKALS